MPDTSLCIHGFWGGRRHRFEPRYNTDPPDLTIFQTLRMSTDFLAGLSKRTYVGDVCPRCGAWRPIPKE